MTSDEAIENAIAAVKNANAGFADAAKAKTRIADSWVRIAEFLRENEARG